MNTKNQISKIHRGAITLMEVLAVFAIAMVVIAFVFASIGGVNDKNAVLNEYTNAGTIILNTRANLRTNGQYDFSGADTMTGSLIQIGGAPGAMGVIGTASSGNAKLVNSWGGNVTVAPAGTDKVAFTMTYEKVPSKACIFLAPKLSNSTDIVSVKVNGTTTTGKLTETAAGSQCKADGDSTIAITTSH